MRHFLLLGLVACGLTPASGCRPAAKIVAEVADDAVTKAGRNLLKDSDEVVQAAPAPRSTPNTHPTAASGPHAKLPGTANVLEESEAVGETLLALEGRIPASVFAQLYREWQRNHAELQSYERQLQEPEISSDRRARLEARMEAIAARQAEIERLAEEWG